MTRPVLRYHGGKFKLAEWVLSHFPPHLTYVEPFCGAASVLMQKPRSPAECINDLDDEIVCLFRVLRDPDTAAQLHTRLELTPYARAEFRAAYERSEDPVERSARLIIRSFMGQGNSATRGYLSGFRCATRNAQANKLPSFEWATYIDAIPVFVDRLRAVAIEHVDAIKLIKRLDSRVTLFYCDPPYVSSTRGYYRNTAYRHEMTDQDHEALAEALHDVTGMVVLSGYPSPLYDRLYTDWECHRTEVTADRGHKRIEALWLNRAAVSSQRQMRMFA